MAERSPSELRSMFGRNLRVLAQSYPSISELARSLGINRTQFNRYLAGESFPRPDVLERLCSFFGTDARILLEPVETLNASPQLMSAPFLRGFFGAELQEVPQGMFPDGFYRFSRRSFIHLDHYVVGIVMVRRDGEGTFLRGYERKEAMVIQGLPTDADSREFRGMVMKQEDGLTLLAARRNAMTCSFNYLNRVASFENNFWVGYITRTVAESIGGLRAARLAYEYLGTDVSAAIGANRSGGFLREQDLPNFHARLLRPGVDFA